MTRRAHPERTFCNAECVMREFMPEVPATRRRPEQQTLIEDQAERVVSEVLGALERPVVTKPRARRTR
ncbi:MAG: hypothetical protein HY744_13295 [Deltaproteobacteria bacterium]|nr:hypothetical protein [Deltaproteobacteria bacterium]